MRGIVDESHRPGLALPCGSGVVFIKGLKSIFDDQYIAITDF
jgi:hypothetical protein